MLKQIGGPTKNNWQQLNEIIQKKHEPVKIKIELDRGFKTTSQTNHTNIAKVMDKQKIKGKWNINKEEFMIEILYTD